MPVLRLLAAFALLLSLAAVAQTSPASDLNVPPGRIRIPVLVTDKEGKPIAGLHAEDFKVLDNGKPASIAEFLAFSTASPVPARLTVFYFDDRRLNMDEMNSARQAVAAALPAALDSNGYVAIVTGTGSVNGGFSRDPVQLRQTLASIYANAFAASRTGAHNFDQPGTYNSLADYAAWMSKFPGRRLLVLLSPGFDSSNLDEIRAAAAAAIGQIVQSGVVLNVLNTQNPASESYSQDITVLEELSNATGGTLFRDSSAPTTLSQYPEILYLIDIPLSTIHADGSSHQLKIEVSRHGSRLRSRKSFVAPRPTK